MHRTRSLFPLAFAALLVVSPAGASAKTGPIAEGRDPGPRAASPESRMRAPATTVRSTAPSGWTIETDTETGSVVFAARNPASLAVQSASSTHSSADFGAGGYGAARPRANEADARRALAAWAGRLRIPNDGADLSLKYERHGLARDVFVFEQRIEGIEVLGAEVGITLWNADPIMIFSGYSPKIFSVAKGSVGLDASSLRASAERASRVVIDALGAPASAAPRTDPIWYRSAARTLERGTIVRVVTADPLGDWVAVVDAASSEIVMLEDNARYAEASSSRVAQRANAIGRVFHPNPVVTLRDVTLTDQLDEDQAAFDSAYAIVELKDLEFSAGVYNLRGPYVEIVDLSAPSIEPPALAESLFLFTRSQDAFEAVNGYYHVDRSQRYLQSLGFDNVAAFPVKLDVHGIGNEDNSLYTPSEKAIRFGDGCVDDAEDADVIYHEYGHAIHDNQVPGWGFGGQRSLVPARSIGEGWGDYWSSSMSSQISGGFDDAQVFDWDRNPGAPCWAARRVDTNRTMDDFVSSGNAIYTNGMIWSGALWDIRAVTGGAVADRLVIESHFGLSPDATYEENATSLALADVALHEGAHLPLILAAFAAREIDVDTTGLAPDSLPPALTVAVLQNPILSAYLDVVVHGSESLRADSVAGEISGAPLVFAQQDAAARTFRAEHKLTQPGALSITVSVEDFAGNAATLSRGYSARLVSGGAETIIASPDGALAVEIAQDAIAEATWVLLGESARVEGPVSGGADEFEFQLGPAGRALATPARVTLVRAPDGGSLEEWTLSLAGVGGAPASGFDPTTGALTFEISQLGTIVARKAAAPPDDASLATLRLHAAWPNPTTGATRVAFDIAAPQRIRLAVYAVTGERVRSLFEGRSPAGASEFAWDGNDDLGRAVASGVYLLRAEGERVSASRKVVVTR
ncbi:MAG: FlgD immunoglobulin-like domain containing protein [bacterium]